VGRVFWAFDPNRRISCLLCPPPFTLSAFSPRSPSKTEPEDGWVAPPILAQREDAVIYELNVHDYTADPSSGVSAEKSGKFLGLVEHGTHVQGRPTGIDHLVDLGVTHVPSRSATTSLRNSPAGRSLSTAVSASTLSSLSDCRALTGRQWPRQHHEREYPGRG
jgi:hypothetical protein